MDASTPTGGMPNPMTKSTPDDPIKETISMGATKGTLPIRRFLFWASVVLIVETLVVTWWFKELKWFPIGNNVVNSAVLGAVLAGSAVGIERFIEFWWTAIGLIKGTTWPLVQVEGQVNKLVGDLDGTMKEFYDHAKKGLAEASTLPDASTAKIDAAQSALASLQGDLNKLKASGTINNQQLELLVSTASARIDQISAVGTRLQGAADVAKQAISVLSSVADGFQDKPGRRLISLYAGMFLGLLVASGIGLDIFQIAPEGATQVVSATATAAGQAVSTATTVTSTTLGVIFTGLVLGLGSSPTHEVIKLVQEVKKKFKSGNASDQQNNG